MSLFLVLWHGQRGRLSGVVELYYPICKLRCPCFLCPPKKQYFSMKKYIINHFHIQGNYIVGSRIDIRPHAEQSPQHGPHPEPYPDTVEDIAPVETSFFCTTRFTPDIIEKNIRQAIELASSKADACRRLMALETQGYIVLSNVGDERKAELINPFAMPKYTLTGQDFRQARNR